MAKYRKKPVVIEAFQYEQVEGAKWAEPQWWKDALCKGVGKAGAAWWQPGRLVVGTLEGEHIVSPGDWIIRGVAGEIYPCKPDIFEQTYEAVDG